MCGDRVVFAVTANKQPRPQSKVWKGHHWVTRVGVFTHDLHLSSALWPLANPSSRQMLEGFLSLSLGTVPHSLLGCSLDLFLSSAVFPVSLWKESGKKQKQAGSRKGPFSCRCILQSCMWGRENTVLRPDTLLAHLACGFFTLFQAEFCQNENDNSLWYFQTNQGFRFLTVKLC